jgi:hypothetical protein
MTFLNDMFDKREPPISDSSRKLYISNLKKLNDGNEPENFNFLKDDKNIYAKIEHLKPTTQRSYIIAICSVLANEPSQKRIYNKYYKVLMQMNNDLKNNTTKSETQKENWVTADDIHKLDDVLTSQIKKIRVSTITKKDYNIILAYMVFSLFTKTAPRRNIDYTLMKLSTDMTDKKFNYLDLKNKRFIFNNYKTNKTYKEVKLDIPDGLFAVIKFYLRFHPQRNKLKNKNHDIYFLVDFKNNHLDNSNDITKILNKVFKKNVGASLLRNMYLTHKYGDVIEELKLDTQDMSTSVGTAMNNYIKTD